MAEEVFALDRFSASGLPAGERMIRVIDERVRRARNAPGSGDEFFRAIVESVSYAADGRRLALIRRPYQDTPDPAPYPVLNGVGVIPGDDVLMVSVGGNPAVCLGALGEKRDVNYGRLAAYTDGLFSGQLPVGFAGFRYLHHPDARQVVTATGAYGINLRNLTVNVTLAEPDGTPSGATVTAYVACRIWPASTDLLTLEQLPRPLTVEENTAPSGTHASYQITHRVIAAEPVPGLASPYPSAWAVHDAIAYSVAANTVWIISSRENIEASIYGVSGLEPGWYRVGSTVRINGNNQPQFVRICVAEQTASGADTSTLDAQGDSPTHRFQNYGASQGIVSAHLSDICAIVPDPGDPAFWFALRCDATSSAKTFAQDSLTIERYNPGPFMLG